MQVSQAAGAPTSDTVSLTGVGSGVVVIVVTESRSSVLASDARQCSWLGAKV